MNIRSILLAIGIVVVIASFFLNDMATPTASSQPLPERRGAAADRAPGVGGTGTAEAVREVTAYNVGVREQTSDEPCIGAAGQDLCRMVDEGHSVCAANFVALGTVLRIQEYGECVVLDRMNRRFAHRVDIAMKEGAVAEAQEFGVQRRIVEVRR